METEKQKVKITVENIQTRLNKVDYSALPNVAGTFRIKTKDSLLIKSASDAGFEISFKRDVFFDPMVIFQISVEFNITGSFDSTSKTFYKDDKGGFLRWVEKYKYDLVNDSGAPSLASSLISSITIYNGLNPVILPPATKREDDGGETTGE